MSIVQKLTEGIVNRDLSSEGAALISKWENTGLLEGIGDDANRNCMARLLENQAKELLRETSSMGAGGDVEGFAAVAFPLVRRVFGSLIANDLVSVQPMSLPSGLIFFLDFTTSAEGAGLPRLGYPSPATSLYGGGRIASQITGGVDLSGQNAERGPYALNNGYSSPTGSVTITMSTANVTTGCVVASGSVGLGGIAVFDSIDDNRHGYNLARLLRFDPDLPSGSEFAAAVIPVSTLTAATTGQFNMKNLIALTLDAATGDGAGAATFQSRRLTQMDPTQTAGSEDRVLVFLTSTGSATVGDAANLLSASLRVGVGCSVPLVDNFAGTANAVGAVQPAAVWGLENNPDIPEIDIKVDSVAVTAVTKKLKAKWTPELGQDLNAYHNLDAEVELTQILSEQIALEIDREILEDLVAGATAGVRYWSRNPGQFLNRETGAEIGGGTVAPDFTGNVSEWYETLIETINDVSAQIHRKTLRGAANFVVCSPEVANILEFTAGFRANVTADSDRGDAGAVKVGSISKKFDIIVDPYFPRELILVGRRGSSFLESGYVYAPYVPLQTTPTIFGVEDFVPRKGVMTRYAKKMVRPDMYGLVVCRALV